MKKIILLLTAVASLGIANSAHAGGFSFGNAIAGGVVAGITSGIIQAAIPRPAPQVVVVERTRTVVRHERVVVPVWDIESGRTA